VLDPDQGQLLVCLPIRSLLNVGRLGIPLPLGRGGCQDNILPLAMNPEPDLIFRNQAGLGGDGGRVIAHPIRTVLTEGEVFDYRH